MGDKRGGSLSGGARATIINGRFALCKSVLCNKVLRAEHAPCRGVLADFALYDDVPFPFRLGELDLAMPLRPFPLRPFPLVVTMFVSLSGWARSSWHAPKGTEERRIAD